MKGIRMVALALVALWLLWMPAMAVDPPAPQLSVPPAPPQDLSATYRHYPTRFAMQEPWEQDVFLGYSFGFNVERPENVDFPVVYAQWYYQTDGVNWFPVEGARGHNPKFSSRDYPNDTARYSGRWDVAVYYRIWYYDALAPETLYWDDTVVCYTNILTPAESVEIYFRELLNPTDFFAWLHTVFVVPFDWTVRWIMAPH